MKKFLALFLCFAMLFSFTACNSNKTGGDENKPPKYNYDSSSLEGMLSFITSTGETANAETTAAAEALIEKLGDSYNTYDAHKADVTAFFDAANTRSANLYAAFQACSIDYFKCVAKQGLSDYKTWDGAMGDFYDAWDDAMGDYYDAWDEAYGDIYDTCDDLISDASDELDYKVYSEAWSAMYKEYSDAWSTNYKAYSDAWSKTYKDYSNCWGGFYRGNTDVDAILADAVKEDKGSSTEEDNNSDDTSSDAPAGSVSYTDLQNKIESTVESTLSSLTTEWETLSSGIDSYKTYLAKEADVEAFYEKVNTTSATLCIQMCQYGIEYAEAILASGRSTDDMYSDLEDIYDLIYDDMGDEIYDGIYDGILDEMYDAFYDGALDERPDGVEYSDWSDARSQEYKWWSDTRSDAYEQWSDYRSDVYEFWSDMRSEMYNDDVDGAKDELADFKKDIEKQAGKNGSTTTTANTTPSATGVSAEFKAAMDSYEEFFDGYVLFMKAYKESADISSMANEYTAMMQQYVQTMGELQKIDQNTLSSEDALYYAEVMLRINQKILSVA